MSFTTSWIFALLFAFGLLSCMEVTAQDTLLLINGKEIPGRLSDATGVDILFEVPSKRGIRELRYERSQIYSYRLAGGVDTVLYEKDPLLGFDLDPQEMRYYMHGQSDARSHKTVYSDIGGFAFGIGATIAMDGGLVPYLSPVVYSLSMQIPVVKVQQSAISDPRNTLSPLYLEGYNRTARSKKFVRNFLSAFSGVVIGNGVLLLIN